MKVKDCSWRQTPPRPLSGEELWRAGALRETTGRTVVKAILQLRADRAAAVADALWATGEERGRQEPGPSVTRPDRRREPSLFLRSTSLHGTLHSRLV